LSAVVRNLSLIREQGKQKLNSIHFSGIHKKILVGSLVFLLILMVVARSGSGTTGNQHVETTTAIAEDAETNSNTRHTTISVTNAPNAYIIMEDGSRHPLPFRVSGAEGEAVRFTIYADDYQSEKQSFDLTPRRSTYDYTLEKMN